MSLLAAVVLALLGALGTGWIVWLRREHERDMATLVEQTSALSTDVAALRTSVESLRLQVVALRSGVEGTRTELNDFIHGPPSMRRPIVNGRSPS